MTVQQLGYFLKLAEELNYTLVAKQFFITQPTLSRQIVNLEQELKVTLFVRNRNSVKLTPEGMHFYQKLKPIFQDLMKLVMDIQNTGMEKDKLMICIEEEQLISNSLTHVITRIQNNHPDMNILIHRGTTEQMLDDFENGKYDIVNMLNLPGIESPVPADFLELEREPMYMAVSKKLVKEEKPKISIDEFCEYMKEYPLLLPDIKVGYEEEDAQQELFHNLNLSGKNVKVVKSGTPISLPVQVASQLGISVCNKSNIFSIDPDVTIMEIEDAPCYVKGILYRRQMDNPYLMEFIKLIKEISIRNKCCN